MNRRIQVTSNPSRLSSLALTFPNGSDSKNRYLRGRGADSDAGADPAFRMEDLANLLRKVRIDLGVDIKIRLDGLRPQTDPQTKTRHTPQYYAVGTIDYPSGGDGVLVYIKTTVTGNEPEDLLAYERQNPSFPDESTADQHYQGSAVETFPLRA